MKVLFFGILFFFFSEKISGQQFLWEKSYPVKSTTDTGFTPSAANQIISISDSTFIVSYIYEIKYGVSSYYYRCALAKINKFGDTIWTKKYNAHTGAPVRPSVFSILPIVGDTAFWMVTGVGDPYLVAGTRRGFVFHKVSFNGNILYKVNALQNLDMFYFFQDAISLGSDGIISVGTITAPSPKPGIHIARVNFLGQTVWDTIINDNPITVASNIERRKNGNVVCSGYAGSRIWSFEMTVDGQFVEKHTWFQDPGFVIWSDAQVISTGDSGYIVRGANTNNTRTYLARYDTNRNRIWGGFQSISTSVPCVFADGGFILVPSFQVLTRYRADSSIKWSITMSVGLIQGKKGIVDMVFFPDESVLAVGQLSFPPNPYNIWLARITNFGQPVPVYLQVKDGPRITQESLIPWPNPSTDKVFLRSNFSSAEVRLYGTSGKEVGQFKLQSGSPLDISGLEKGMYLYRAVIDGKGYSGKVVKN